MDRFLARDSIYSICLARYTMYAIARPSVCLSVRVSDTRAGQSKLKLGLTLR